MRNSFLWLIENEINENGEMKLILTGLKADREEVVKSERENVERSVR